MEIERIDRISDEMRAVVVRESLNVGHDILF